MRFMEKLLNYTVIKCVSAYGNICRKKQIKDSRNVDKISERLLLDLIRKNKNTEFGRKYDFKNIHSIEDYQDKVPFTVYDDYRDYIERIVNNGEQNILTSDEVVFFAKTSGTTGEMKRIPVVKKATKPYSETVAVYMNIIRNEMKKNGIHYGKGLNTVEIEMNKTPGGIQEGLISAYTLESRKFAIPIITCFPKEIFGYGEGADMKYLKAFYALKDPEITYMAAVFMSNITDLMTYIFENRDMLINDIEKGVINENVDIPRELKESLNSKLTPDKKRAEELRVIFNQYSHKGIMKKIWKKLCVIIGIGTGEFEGFARKLRNYCGDNVSFYYETYSSSEALMANARDVEDDNYLLLTDSGFFEFIPVNEKTKRPLMSHQLEVGKLYEIVITNLSGLYRYRIKDVIRVTGFEGKNPLIHFAYRENQIINITGVKLTVEHISNAMKAFESAAGIHISDYTLYPDTSYSPWRLTVFLETEEDLTAKQKNSFAGLFDEKLSEMNHEHGRMLKIGETAPSIIYQVEKNTFRKYREFRVTQGASQNQIKITRVINSPEVLQLFKNNIKIC